MKYPEDLINKIICDDCLKVLPSIPNKSVDMILCDLPYGTTQNQWDSIIPLNELWRQYERIIKDNGVIALTSQGIFTAKLIVSNQALFKYKIVWIKSKSTNFLNAKKQPLRKHEDICIFYKKQPTYNPQMSEGEAYNKGYRKNQLTGSYGKFNSVQVASGGGRYPTDIIYFKTVETEGTVFHSTQKPVALFEYLIKTYTNKGMLVLDNCIGSGTTAVACKNLGRSFIGFEKEFKYVEIANKRLSEYVSKSKK
jgi:site-specific DNA-methyltransferase (adenine-specific)/modification methylase